MDKYVLIKEDALNNITGKIAVLIKEIEELKKQKPIDKKYYSNQELRELLQVNNKQIRKYRNDGLLSYHQVGGKYWYEASEVMRFLERNRFCA